MLVMQKYQLRSLEVMVILPLHSCVLTIGARNVNHIIVMTFFRAI